MQVFTIGHAERRTEAIVGELTFHGVTHVLDIRPFTSRAECETDISPKLMVAGVRYADLSKLFGYGDEILLAEADAMRESERHDANVQILLEIANQEDRLLCLMGALHEAHKCPRCFLLGEALYENGVVVTHIENGMALHHPFVMERLMASAHVNTL